MNANHPRVFFVGIVVAAIALALFQVALFEASPVLFGAVIALSCGAMWLLWLEPFGRSITRDVANHMHEIDE